MALDCKKILSFIYKTLLSPHIYHSWSLASLVKWINNYAGRGKKAKKHLMYFVDVPSSAGSKLSSILWFVLVGGIASRAPRRAPPPPTYTDLDISAERGGDHVTSTYDIDHSLPRRSRVTTLVLLPSSTVVEPRQRQYRTRCVSGTWWWEYRIQRRHPWFRTRIWIQVLTRIQVSIGNVWSCDLWS